MGVVAVETVTKREREERMGIIDKRYCPQCGEEVYGTNEFECVSCKIKFKYCFKEPVPKFIKERFFQDKKITSVCPQCGEEAFLIHNGTFCANCGAVFSVVTVVTTKNNSFFDKFPVFTNRDPQ